jgi:radical S-adenosyl methionine domain-containing protein 2
MENLGKKAILPAVNFHLWEPCNMRCGFCFATFQDVKRTVLPKGHLPKEDCLRVVELLCQAGIEKINFAGGEPTLCPWLYEAVALAKSKGVTTSIVTNGASITPQWLLKFAPVLDWIGLSIDSFQNDTNLLSGRAVVGKKVLSAVAYIDLCEQIRKAGIRLKINTVVNQTNHEEDMRASMQACLPERWKIFQVLPVQGQNDAAFAKFAISDGEYRQFLSKHADCLPDGVIVPEDNSDMRGSYLMVDPAGRFFDNVAEGYQYSSPILTAGVETALHQTHADYGRFVHRNGLYDWRR